MPKKPKSRKKHEIDGPTVLSLNICDTIIRDRITGKVSLIGLFNNINARDVPCIHPEFSIFVALTSGHGLQKVEVRIVQLDQEEIIMTMGGSVQFNEPLDVVELNLACRGVRFTAYGVYAVEVYCGDMDVAKLTRKFRVSPTEDGSKT